MELRLPSVEQLRTVYDRDLKEAFPTAELKPLRNIEKSWAEGWYKPYCLFDGDNIVGEAFLWLGHPGWALLDYLCVSSIRRNGGVGASILEKLREREADTVIFGESEARRTHRTRRWPAAVGLLCPVRSADPLGMIRRCSASTTRPCISPAVRWMMPP